MYSLQIVFLCFNILLYFQIEKKMARRYPDCGHVRPKGDRHRRCVPCLGRDHAEGALSGKAPVCSICASLPLAKATRRLAFWKHKDAEETALVPSGADAPVGMLLWAARHVLSLRAVHIPGHLNYGADLLSRGDPRAADWCLHPQVIEQIWMRFFRAQVDLFANRQNTCCPL